MWSITILWFFMGLLILLMGYLSSRIFLVGSSEKSKIYIEPKNPRYDQEIGVNTDLYSRNFNYAYDRFEEVELSDCEYGCKIYVNQRTGHRVLAHNSAYGCRIGAKK